MSKILPIYIHPHPVLQQVALPVGTIDAATLSLAEDMLATLAVADGVGLAAPQVGHSTQLIVIDIGEAMPDGRRNYAIKRPEVLFNPQILAYGDEKHTRQEGCLSLPGLWAEVERSTSIKVRYTTQGGEVIDEEATGFKAVVLQHEIDHLNGVLFTDKLTPARKALAMPKWQKLRQGLLRQGGEFDIITAERGLVKAAELEETDEE